MKTQLMTRSLSLTCALALLSLTTSMAAEAEREPGERQASPPPRRLERPAPEGIRPMAAPGRVLTDDQRAQLRELFGRHRDRMLELEEQLRIARRELHEVLASGEAEEPAIRRRVAEVVELETARIIRRLRLLREIRPELTPEQRERLRGWFPGMAGPRETLRQVREPGADRQRAEPRRDRERQEDLEPRREGPREERELIRRDDRPDRPAVRPERTPSRRDGEREAELRDRAPEERREREPRAPEAVRPGRERPESVHREESKDVVRPQDGGKDRDHDHN